MAKKTIEIRNPRRNASGGISMTIIDPELGPIPFATKENSGDPRAEAIWQLLKDRKDIAPYEPEPGSDEQQRWRETAVVDHTTFVRNCRRVGILSNEEAKAAAKGEWPDSFADALADLPSDIDATDAEILWAGRANIRRNHKILKAVQDHHKLTDELVDSLFAPIPD